MEEFKSSILNTLNVVLISLAVILTGFIVWVIFVAGIKFFFETKANCIQDGTLPTNDFTDASIWADYIFLETEQNRLYVQKKVGSICNASVNS
jgi:hypothetical protein